MAKIQRGQGAPIGTQVKQPRRESPAPVRNREPHAPDNWLASVVFGPAEAKIPVNIRLDADIVRFFRAGGAGYQTRINDVLKAFVHARIRAGEIPGAPPKARANGRKKAR